MINRKTRYPNNFGDVDSDMWPLGEPRNDTSENATDGSGWEKDIYKDHDAFFQRLYKLGKVTVSGSGTPDNADACQSLDALFELYGVEKSIYSESSTPSNKEENSYCRMTSVQLFSQAKKGSFLVSSSLTSGGVRFSGDVSPGEAISTVRLDEFSIDITDISFSSGFINYIPSGGKTLTGIPIGSRIYSASIEVVYSTLDRITIPVKITANSNAGETRIVAAQGSSSGALLSTNVSSTRLFIWYNPQLIGL